MRYVVLGMHKSGTTLLAQTMHRSGIPMIGEADFDADLPYDEGNQYERLIIDDLNKEMLGCGEKFSLTITRELDERHVDEATRQEMSRILTGFDDLHEEWGFKDPRTCLTYLAWKPTLGHHKVLAIYRHPIEVWHHYVKRVATKRMRFFLKPIRGWAALRAWFIYNSRLLACHRELGDDCLLIEYGAFMRDDRVLETLGRFLGREMIDERRPDLYRGSRDRTLLYLVLSRIQAWLFRRDVEKLYRSLEAQSN